jgi:NADPH2:quinone reductase
LLKLEDRPDPAPEPGQVVMAVEAAGVNFVDALFVGGQYQIKPLLPFTPGGEVAGRVISLGEGVTELSVDDRVMATTGLGGFASHVALAAGSLSRLPDVLDSPRAATFSQSYCTSLYALRERAQLQPGESVLVLGAGGGIGLAAIAVARVLGARVIGAASSEEKRHAALAAGADAVIDSSSESIKDRAREWAGGTGVDVVMDPISGPAAQPSLRALGDGGRYLVVGFASGTIADIPLNQVLLRNRTVVGIDWGIWSLQHPAHQNVLLADLLEMVADGRLDPVHPVTYPLSNAATALTDLLERRVVGKMALIP